jgi:hypothetical protein
MNMAVLLVSSPRRPGPEVIFLLLGTGVERWFAA